MEMENVSQLSIIFHEKIQNLLKEQNVLEKKPSDSSSNNNNNYKKTRWLASWSSSPFQMPYNYPNYTKEEYEVMSEEDLDRLLKLYGMPVDLGDLSCKRQFAIGAFLWEKEIDCSLDEVDSEDTDLCVEDLDESSLMGLVRDMVKSVFRV